MMANEEALEEVADLIADLDVDVDPASRAQIHVIYLEHAKAEDVSQVLSNLLIFALEKLIQSYIVENVNTLYKIIYECSHHSGNRP